MVSPIEGTTSQNAEILAYLKAGNKLTSLEAWKLFGCSALHSRISDLRNKLHEDIKGDRVTVETSRGKKSVILYYLSGSLINEGV